LPLLFQLELLSLLLTDFLKEISKYLLFLLHGHFDELIALIILDVAESIIPLPSGANAHVSHHLLEKFGGFLS
jgi:hypothetical protein